MSRRSRALKPALVLAAIAVAAAVPASAQTARDITVREKAQAVKFVHQRPAKRPDVLAMGDRVITRQALFDESDRRIGSFHTDCLNGGARAQVFKATLICTSIYRFADGQVVSQGVVKLGGNPASARIAIVGGTGAYRSARGEVSAAAPVEGYDSVDHLSIDG